MSEAKKKEVLGENQRVKIAREAIGLTQGQLADILRMPRSAMSKIENGTQAVPLELTMFLGRTYKVSYDWLIDGNGEMFLNETASANDHSFKARDISRATGMQVITHGGADGSGSQVQILAIELENLKQRLQDKDTLLAYKDEMIKQQQERIEELKETIRELKGKQA